MTREIDAEVDELQRSGRLQGVTLYAFGHSAATEQLRRSLERHGHRLAAVLDNNPQKQGGVLAGVPIVAPARIGDGTGPSAVVIASRFHVEMRRQLLSLGYAGEIVRLGACSIPTDTGAGADRGRGVRLLARLSASHRDRHLIVCPFDALGDVYWALAYLPAYVAARSLAPPVPVVVGAGCEQVARLFGHREVECLSQTEMDDLVSATALTRPRTATVAHHDRPYGESAPVRVLDDRFLTFTDLYRDVVYGLGPHVEAQGPVRRRIGSNHGSAPWRALPRGRTVLLAPYAKSVLAVPSSFWEGLVEQQSRRGHTVATLVHGAEEPVGGTVGLSVPIPQLSDAVEHAGTFIALRSGLCDIVHTARARKVHVAPDACYSTTRHRVGDFFALPGWESTVVPVL